MKLANVTLKTDKDLSEFLTGIFKPHAEALQGILDKLPEALKPDFLKLKRDVDEQLSKLAPTDQVPAALDAANALQSFAWAMERMQEMALQVTNRLTALANDYKTKEAAYQGFETKLAAGDLLTKQQATDLVAVAKREALDSVKPQIIAMRKQQVELAGLPTATDELLGLPEAEFAVLFADAKKNVTELGKRGLKLGGKGDGLVKDLAWHKTEAFQGKLSAYEDVLGKPTHAEPLLGNPAVDQAENKDKAKARMW